MFVSVQVKEVVLKSGTVIPADVLIVGIGMYNTGHLLHFKFSILHNLIKTYYCMANLKYKDIYKDIKTLSLSSLHLLSLSLSSLHLLSLSLSCISLPQGVIPNSEFLQGTPIAMDSKSSVIVDKVSSNWRAE